ncbi:protein of unknown function [Hyphomicrobium sp. 1Nfss2.1]
MVKGAAPAGSAAMNAKATASGPAVVRNLVIRGLLELSLRGVASTAPTGAGESRRSESINYVETPGCVSKIRRYRNRDRRT